MEVEGIEKNVSSFNKEQIKKYIMQIPTNKKIS